MMVLPVWAAMRPMEVTRLASAPRVASLYGLSWRMASIEMVPFELIGVRLGRGLPDELLVAGVLSAVGTAGAAAGGVAGDRAQALACREVAGEVRLAAGHAAAVP